MLKNEMVLNLRLASFQLMGYHLGKCKYNFTTQQSCGHRIPMDIISGGSKLELQSFVINNQFSSCNQDCIKTSL